MADEAAEADADDRDKACRHGTEDDRPRHAGMAEGHLEVLGGKIRWPSSNPARSTSSAIGNTNAATVAALAAITSRRAGIALKVERIMPVAYSAVTVRTASAPSRVATMMTPNSDALVASKFRAAGRSSWPVERSTAAVKPMARAAANAAVRQVEGRVRSFVHSPLRCRLIVVAGPARSEGV